jgi:hypothetical protein
MDTCICFVVATSRSRLYRYWLNKLVDYSSRSDLSVRLVISMCYNVVISIVQV